MNLKVTRLSIIFILGSIFILGCGNKNNSTPGVTELKTFESDSTFKRDIFGSQDECDKARQSNPVVNCFETVSFNADGTSSMMVTDIMYAGTYNIVGNDITISLTGYEDIGNDVKYSVVSENEIKDRGGNIWTKKN